MRLQIFLLVIGFVMAVQGAPPPKDASRNKTTSAPPAEDTISKFAAVAIDKLIASLGNRSSKPADKKVPDCTGLTEELRETISKFLANIPTTDPKTTEIRDKILKALENIFGQPATGGATGGGTGATGGEAGATGATGNKDPRLAAKTKG